MNEHFDCFIDGWENQAIDGKHACLLVHNATQCFKLLGFALRFLLRGTGRYTSIPATMVSFARGETHEATVTPFDKRNVKR